MMGDIRAINMPVELIEYTGRENAPLDLGYALDCLKKLNEIFIDYNKAVHNPGFSMQCTEDQMHTRIRRWAVLRMIDELENKIFSRYFEGWPGMVELEDQLADAMKAAKQNDGDTKEAKHEGLRHELR